MGCTDYMMYDWVTTKMGRQTSQRLYFEVDWGHRITTHSQKTSNTHIYAWHHTHACVYIFSIYLYTYFWMYIELTVVNLSNALRTRRSFAIDARSFDLFGSNPWVSLNFKRFILWHHFRNTGKENISIFSPFDPIQSVGKVCDRGSFHDDQHERHHCIQRYCVASLPLWLSSAAATLAAKCSSPSPSDLSSTPFGSFWWAP